MSTPQGFEDKVAFVWKVADKLRGHLKPHEYGQIMLPFLVLRRLDCVLEPTKTAVLEAHAAGKPDPILRRIAGHPFYNHAPHTFTTLLADDKNIATMLKQYVHGFSPAAAEVLEAYDLMARIDRLDKAKVLYQVVGDFADLDLHPDVVSNEAMGAIFEELLRKFSEMSNETAGEHYTPREVIRLMVSLLLKEDEQALRGPSPVRTVYDPAAGTGGMLTTMVDVLTGFNDSANVQVYGQELNPETWAIARSDLMLKNTEPERIAFGNSLTEDAWRSERFDYMLANPPYGVDWKTYADPIKTEHARDGFDGRFGAGLPRVSDGSFLFLQHMLSKMKPVADDPATPQIEGGSRIAIVLSGSPLFSGAAGGGESEIRRWIIENDWLEGIVALPDQMFYNTGISTYVWVLTNRKPADRRGTVTLVDARESGTKMRKSLGDKRKELTQSAIDEICDLFDRAVELASAGDEKRVKVMRNEEFGFQRITVERPLRRRWEVNDDTLAAVAADKSVAKLDDEPRHALIDALTTLRGAPETTDKAFVKRVDDAMVAATGTKLDAKLRKSVLAACAIPDPDAAVITKKDGSPEPDSDLRDAENVPLPVGYLDLDDEARAKVLVESAEQHLRDEVHPYVPDAWIDHTKTKIGYEIPFTRQFYVYIPPRTLEEIDAELLALEAQIQEWMKGLAR